MSTYKSAIRTQPQAESSEHRKEARQLKELFPEWSIDDLLILLSEVHGDVQVAATKITDGDAQPFGQVTHKKDKKAQPAVKEPAPFRGESRGTRGGRGGPRGGALGRGGATRGRGGVGRGGATHRTDSPRPASTASINGSVPEAAPKAAIAEGTKDQHDQQNAVTPSTSGWTEASSQPETSTSTTSVSAAASPWGTPAAPASSWNAEADANGSATVHAPAARPAVKPATSKLSWAQIASKPQEKAAPPPPPPVQAPQPMPPSPVHEPAPAVREEPTTVQAHVWDDEPTAKASVPNDNWSTTAEPVKEEPQPKVEPEPVPEVKEEPVVEASPPAPEPVREEPVAKPEPKAISPLPAHAVPQLQAAATPSPKLASRGAVGVRAGPRYKVTDQPVVMPSSFGNIEKVGMQFGSLSLGGESLTEPTPAEPEQAPAPPPPGVQEPPAPKVETKPQFEPAAPPPATAPASSASLASTFPQQQQQQQQPIPQAAAPQVPATQAPQTHHALPGSVSQPIHSTQPSIPTHSTLQQYTQQHQPVAQQQQPTLSVNHQQAPHLHHLPQQLQQSHTHQSYGQHNLPSQLETSSQVQPTVQQQQQPALQNTSHSNYFRQSEATSAAPYFNTPTPPATQSHDTPYGSFGQLNTQNQQQQQQTSHSSGFASADYGYGDNQRNFYESYGSQQTGFGGRNVLGHEDSKSVPASQASANSGLPPTAAQSAQQQHGNVQGTGPAQQAGVAPQGAYAHQMPYYYSYPGPQNQYFGGYNSGYAPPFVKYPIFQPGPPGPGSGPNPGNKQPGSNVGVGLPQQSPYNQQNLYQGYDDYPHQQQPHQQSHNLGLGQGGVASGDYGKQLYGSSGQVGGMQGFMGLSGQTSGVGGPNSSTSGPRSGASPEAAYKPYGKDVGVGAGRNASVQQPNQGQGQPQSQGQGQGGQGVPQAQGFYGGHRFGSGVGGGVGGVGSNVGGVPQQSGHHQSGPQGHLNYSQQQQSANDANFYQYRQGGGGYWQ